MGILQRCSAGLWRHGLRIPAFSADSQWCVYGDEGEFPLAILDEDDEEAWANVVLLAAAWELCQELSTLVGAAVAAARDQLRGTESWQLRERCNSARALVTDQQRSADDQQGDEKIEI